MTASPRLFLPLVTAWIALTIGGVVVSVIAWTQLDSAIQARSATGQFRLALDDVLDRLQDADSSQRGFLLTGEERYAAHFQTVSQALPGDFDQLAQLAAPQPRQLDAILELKGLAELKFSELRRSIEARRGNDGFNIALGLVRQSDANALTEKIRASIGEMRRQTEEQFAAQTVVTGTETRRSLVTTLSAGIFALGAGALALYIATISLRQEKDARRLAENAVRNERAMQEKSAFLANMSHEIRTPMNAILGFSDLLAAELPATGRMRQYARSIRESALSLLQLINDILDLSKIEAGMIELHPEPTDLREVADFLRTVFSQHAARKELHFETVLPATLPPAVMIDRSRLRQVFVNLIGNALKFTEKGSVTLRLNWEADRALRTHGTLYAEVTDTGIGIPAEMHRQIFEPFVQVDSRRASEQQGTGLGLSIVKRLVERMGGRIRVQSEIAVGSIFRLEFPGLPLSARLPGNPQLEENIAVDFDSLQPSTILVVDDNAVNRDLIAGFFAGTQHKMQFATNGREALERVRESRPDLVLMDIRMPEMDGPSALSEIKKIPGCEILPVIAVTASSLLDDQSAVRGHFAGYVRKPFTRHILFQEFAAFLPRRAVPRERVGEGDSKSPFPRLSASTSPHPEPAVKAIGDDELLRTLRGLEASRWVKLRESGALSEARQFSKLLTDLSLRSASPALAAYAAALSEEVEIYAIGRIAERLDKFPSLIKDIDSTKTPTAKTA